MTLKKRLKHKYPTSQAHAHEWANQPKDDTRDLLSRNTLSTPSTYYSYRQSYPIAIKVNNLILVDNNRHPYSATTRDHISEVYRAINHLDQIRVPHDIVDRLNHQPQPYQKPYLKQAATIWQKLLNNQAQSETTTALRFRCTDKITTVINNLVYQQHQYDKFHSFFKLGKPKNLINKHLQLLNEHLSQQRIKNQQQALLRNSPEYIEKQKKRQEQKLKKLQEDIKSWRNHEIKTTKAILGINPQIVRLRTNDENTISMQTSKGFRANLTRRQLDQLYKDLKDPEVTSIFDISVRHRSPTQITIGCHTLTFEEIDNAYTHYSNHHPNPHPTHDQASD